MTTRLQRIKLLGGERTQQVNDDLLMLYLDLVEAKVKNYCHRDDVPEGLALVVDEIVAGYAAAMARQDDANAGAGAVTSIKRGDTTISYAASGDGQGAASGGGAALDAYVFSFERQLNAYRKVLSR